VHIHTDILHAIHRQDAFLEGFEPNTQNPTRKRAPLIVT
jgi:hypothetical protein